MDDNAMKGKKKLLVDLLIFIFLKNCDTKICDTKALYLCFHSLFLANKIHPAFYFFLVPPKDGFNS